ncbi:MAG TPA: type II secretion system protein GspE, partial [Candidatus Omnitrophica bacterium]|nr:type II secretion system protein GspE [Candidatus Omnitrophota bacterium]
MDRGKRIGDILLEEGTITESQFAEALKIQKEKGGLLGEILLQMGVIDEEKLVDILSKKVGVPKVNLEEFEIQGEVLNFVPENVARRHVLIPISQEDGILNVAMADPFDIYALDELKFITRMQIKPYMATRTAISKAIDEYYGATESMEEIV